MSELSELGASIALRAEDGEQVEVYAVRSHDTEIEVFDGEVESLSVASVEGLGVRVVTGQRQGYAWCGSLDPMAIQETLGEARDNAEFSVRDEWVGLAAPGDVDWAAPPLDLFRAELSSVPTDDKVTFALDLERATRTADQRVRGVEAAGYGDSVLETAVVSSLGVSASTRRTTCSAHAFAIAGEGADTQTGAGFAVGRSFAELDVAKIAEDAATRAVRLLGARQPRSRRLPVLFDPLVTGSLVALVGLACSGEAVTKGRSMFVDRLGEAVAAAGVTLVEDPTLPDATGASPHDGEGVPTRRNALIEGGVLGAFLHNTYTGRRSGRGTTGSAVRGFKSVPGVGSRALFLEPGRRTPEEIMASVPEALYVQSVSGLHSGTNIVSGDFSVGAEGLVVRDGEFAEPVREVTIASTLPRMLLDIVEVGGDLEWLPGGAAGQTLLVSEMTLSGS